MKFSDVFIVLVLMGLFTASLGFAFNTIQKIDSVMYETKSRRDSLSFISRSFANTCNGCGFESLNNWQKACKALWKLDYIAWSDACEFFDIEKGNMFYGRWNGPFGEGEVYCSK